MKIAFLRIPLYACTALALLALVAPKPDATAPQGTAPADTLHTHSYTAWHAASPSWQSLFGTARW